MSESKASKNKELLWQSRFSEPFDEEALKFSSSVEVDWQLYKDDIQGSIAHVTMLGEEGIISEEEATQIIAGLQDIEQEFDNGKIDLDWRLEDIHTVIENRLKEKIGDVAGKVHSGRSRNDQVATDTRLYLHRTISDLKSALNDLNQTLYNRAESHQDVIMFGYTHLQRAQPILISHYYLAYLEMFLRDIERLDDLYKRVNRSALGAAAFAGSSLPLNINRTASLLGFESPFRNSTDAISDRDIIIEFISACSIIMMHLSRFAEDVILWSSEEFKYLQLSDSFSTGSSIMPQKKNADIAELVRGKTGRVYGDLMNILTIMKGLPLSYNRDMQEDKPPLFDAAKSTLDSVRIFNRLIQNTTINRERLKALTEKDMSLATEIAEYLVEKNIPFRDAHRITGKIVTYALEHQTSLPDMSLDVYKTFSSVIESDIYAALTPESSVNRKKSQGSTSPASVKQQLAWHKAKLSQS